MVRNERDRGMGMGMLPLPSSSSSSSTRRNRIYFPSNPPSSQSFIGHLRSRTRLTNLAVGLILLLTISSLLLNASYHFSRDPSDYGRGRDGREYKYATSSGGSKGKGSWDTTIGNEEGRRSIEDTIDRDPRMEKLDHMVMVPGHAIYLGSNPEKVQEDEEWVLEPMQKGKSVGTFIKHVKEGIKVVGSDERALLVFSG